MTKSDPYGSSCVAKCLSLCAARTIKDEKPPVMTTESTVATVGSGVATVESLLTGRW